MTRQMADAGLARTPFAVNPVYQMSHANPLLTDWHVTGLCPIQSKEQKEE